MVRRLVRWLLGIPPKDQVDAHRAFASERDRAKTGAVVASDAANVTGARRNHGPQEW